MAARIERIDLNSDLGEGFGPWTMGDDKAMLDIVTSANIAAGGHASDPETMFATLGTAAARGVVVGAHPGYPDREGFGRRVIPMAPAEIGRMVAAQTGALSALAQDLLALDPRSAVAHMAAGNTWSLQHQHDAAYQCFQQATLVAPECAYAYTLAGYEALELDQPVRAMRLFRCARRCDRREPRISRASGWIWSCAVGTRLSKRDANTEPSARRPPHLYHFMLTRWLPFGHGAKFTASDAAAQPAPLPP